MERPELGPYMYRFSRTTSLASPTGQLRRRPPGVAELFGPAVVVGGVEAEVHGVGVRGDLSCERLSVASPPMVSTPVNTRVPLRLTMRTRVPWLRSASATDRPAGPVPNTTCVRGGQDVATSAGTNGLTIMLCRKVEVIAP